MRKAIYILLAFILLPGLFGCVKNSSVPPAGTVNTDDPVTAEPDEEFVWTREGYFSDEDGNFVYISASEDEENPGWYVGGCIGEDTYGWYIGQEGKTLHGNIAAPYEEEGTEFYVTVSEDGEQDILLEVNGGETYRLACYEIKYEDSVPTSTAINEAVELAKNYGTENSGSFVNGILAKVVKND